MKKNEKIIFVCLITLFLLIRVVYLCTFPGSPGKRLLTFPGDQGYYHGMAQSFAHGNILIHDGNLERGAAYSYFVGLIYALAGPHDIAVRCVQHILGLLSGIAIIIVGLRLFNASVGLCAGLLYALYGPAVAYEGTLLPETLIMFCVTGGLAAFIEAQKRSAWRGYALAGALFGGAYVMRPNNLLFIVLLSVFIVIRTRKARPLVIFLSAALLIVLPFIVRNVAAGGKPLALSQQAQPVIMLGHYHTSNGIGATQDSVRLNENDQDRIDFIRFVLTDIYTHFGSWLFLQFNKLYVYFFGFEYSQFVRKSALCEYVPWIAPLWHTMMLIAPLCIVGLLLMLVRRPIDANTRLFLCYFCVAVLTTVLFYVESRFRYHAIGLFCIAGGYGVCRIWNIVRWGTLKARIVSVITLCLAIVLTNLPPVRAALTYHLHNKNLFHWQNLYLLQENRALKDVLDYLQLEKYTNLTDTNNLYFTISRDEYIARRPLAKRAAVYVGIWYGDHNDVRNSIKYLNLAENLGDHSVLLMNYIGEYYVATDDYEKALRYFQESLETNPGQHFIMNNLAGCLFHLGQEQRAVELWRMSIRLYPFNPAAHFNLGTYYYSLKKYTEAQAHFKQALRFGYPEEQIAPYLARTHRRLSSH